MLCPVTLVLLVNPAVLEDLGAPEDLEGLEVLVHLVR